MDNQKKIMDTPYGLVTSFGYQLNFLRQASRGEAVPGIVSVSY
jgi:hypothetical protein